MANDALRVWVERFRRERGYPIPKDEEQIARRKQLLDVLAEGKLDAAIADPATFDLVAFRGIGSREWYGGAGNQARINEHLRAGAQAIAKLARTIRHLLYGPGEEEDRLDDVLDDPGWRVRGFAEALATKCLAIVYPDRWLPLFLYHADGLSI